MALLPYSDGFAGPGQQHGLICLRFPHLVSTIRKNVISGAGVTGFVRGDGHDHVTHSVGGSVHHHGVGASVDDLKVDVGEGGVALGSGSHLAVLLFQVNAAPDHIIFGVVLQHLTILVDGHGNFLRKCLKHGLVGGNLPHRVVPVGKNTLPGGSYAAGVGGDGHGHLAGGCGGTVDHHGVLTLVDDLKGDPFQRGVALGCGASLTVFLLNGQAAPLDFLRQVRNFQRVGVTR